MTRHQDRRAMNVHPLSSFVCAVLLTAALFAVIGGSGAVAAADATPAAAAVAVTAPRPTIPVEKDANRHQEFLAVAKAGGIDLLFLGDSITDFWRRFGAKVWEAEFAPLKAANFGVNGDHTEHVIWRIRHGELDGFSAKVIVLMIGTNNQGDAPAATALGIRTILDDIHDHQPQCRVLLLAIFPRGEKPQDPGRVRNDQVNRIISGYADGHAVYYLDIGAKFLDAEGILTKEIMPDLLHPSEKGYQIEADAIMPMVTLLMKQDPSALVPFFHPLATAPRIAHIESGIACAKYDATAKTLEQLGNDQDPATADDANSALAFITAWKTQIDAEIAKYHDAGDLYYASELAAGMERHYGGDDAKTYRAEIAEWKKDPAYAAGKDYPTLTAIPSDQRSDPRFTKMVEAFVKKYPDTVYVKKAEALLPDK